jgi:hypothetical protein
LSLIVEDGTARSDSESFISLADATTRHGNTGNAAWAAVATDALREQALRRATQYMEQAYRARWLGMRVSADQALSWPRAVLEPIDDWWIESNVVPPEVANACADLALKALAGELNADLTRGVVRKKIGPLETEFDPYSPQSVRYRAIDMALAPYLKGSSAMATLVRA